MSEAFTCKSYIAGKRAPSKIQLLGDKRKPESAQHIIEFPGGAVEVSRTTDGNYWAHIIINRGWSDNDCDGLRNAVGKIVAGRIDTDEGVCEVSNHNNISQIALLIKPVRV